MRLRASLYVPVSAFILRDQPVYQSLPGLDLTASSTSSSAKFVLYVVFEKNAFGIANQKFENDLSGSISKEINRAFVDIHMNHPEMTITLGSFSVKIKDPFGIQPDNLLSELQGLKNKSEQSVFGLSDYDSAAENAIAESEEEGLANSKPKTLCWVVQIIRPLDFVGRMDLPLLGIA